MKTGCVTSSKQVKASYDNICECNVTSTLARTTAVKQPYESAIVLC